MIRLESEAALIIDEITERIKKLESIKKKLDIQNQNAERLNGKIEALEELRAWITVNYFW